MTNKPDIQTVYVTKYWQTKGIFELRAEIVKPMGGNVLYASTLIVPDEDRRFFLSMNHEAFLDKTKAEVHVQALAAKRIKSLRKQLAKLEKAYPEAAEVK